MNKISDSDKLRFGRKLSLSFGAVVLVLVLLAIGAAVSLFHRTQNDEENRLCGAITAVLSESISRVSFSGKYQTRQLVQEMLTRTPELAYISVESASGEIFAHSDPAFNDQTVATGDLAQIKQSIESTVPVLVERTRAGRVVKEVVAPYRGGYDNQVVGVVRVGVRVDSSRQEQWANLAKILFLVAGLTLAAIVVVQRLSRYFGGAATSLALQLQGILNNSPTAIAICDDGGRLLATSAAFDALVGQERKESQQAQLITTVLPGEIGHLLRGVDEGEMDSRVDREIRFGLGEAERCWHITRFPIARDESGGMRQSCVFVRDVTEARAAEARTRELLLRLHNITATVPVVLYEIAANNPDNPLENRFSYVSEKVQELLGVSAKEMVSDPASFSSKVHPEDAARIATASREAIASGGEFNEDFRVLVGGGEKWVRASSMPSGQADGVRTWSGYLMDITESKRNELALARSEEKFRAIFSNAPIGIFRSTFRGGLVEVNAAVARMHAFASPEVMLANVLDLTFDAYPNPGERRRLLDALLATPQGVRMELTLRRSTGEVFPAIINASLQMGADGAPLFIDGSIEDITERKLLEQRLADQLAFQQALMDTIPYAVFYKGGDTRFVGCNKAYEEMFGIRRENFIGKRVLDLEYLPEKDRQEYQAEDEETIATVGRVRKEWAIPFADGMVHQTLYSVNGFRQADGTPGGLIGIIVDISDLKRAEMALRESEARYRLLVDNSVDAVVLADLDGNILDENEAMEQMLGYSSAELRRMKVWDVDPNVPVGGFRSIWEAMAPERPMTIETVHRAKDGSLHEVEVRASRVDEGGRTYVLGMTRDITERRRGEAALRASEARFRAFMDNLPGYVVIKDAESRPVYFNQRFLDIFPGEDWLGKAPGEVFPAPVGAQVLETDEKALSDGFVVFTEDWHDRNGEHRLLETRKFRIKQETGQNLIGAIITDITEQRYNEEKYRVLFHASTDAIFMIKDNSIVDCNPRTLAVFDCPMERMMGHNPGEFSPPVQPGGRESVALALEMIERARRGDTQTFEWQHLRCDGSVFTAEVTLTVMDLFREEYVVGFLRDISERKQMQELMVQTEKMMSVGGLAAGMAHELNNPLGIILQSVQNMERRLSTTLPKNQVVAQELALNLGTVGEYMRARGIDEYMRGIQEAGDRAAKIIRTMLDFSRSSQSVRATCDVNEMLDTALNLAANDYDLKKRYDFRNIAIEKDYDQGTGALECTETEIVQVLLNIIKNAAQAMPGRGDRSDAPTLRLHSKILADAVRVEIEDNGPGMDEATRRRVFEPFFTTKPQGEGTGLGLSVGYFIVTQKHKGKISVESHPGVGTTFAIELPLQ